VRPGRSSRYCPEDYGKKADYILATAKAIRYLWKGVLFDWGECWVYYPRKISDTSSEIYMREVQMKNKPQFDEFKKRFAGKKFIIDITPPIQPALDWYKENHDKKRTVEWPTKGTAMILATIRLLRPARMTLVGFDWIANRDLVKPYRHHDMGHDIACERALIDYISQRRGVDVSWQLPMGVAKP
jgi:hypothetical protein